ncbi:hypothetical protein ABEB36_004219 [Hypothenemus hampei]|uniref:Uncharacterized protein n=1 Tax=Hypothenemus hampei TaxID=57062 RepID=A0ABD1F416_HYPHA
MISNETTKIEPKKIEQSLAEIKQSIANRVVDSLRLKSGKNKKTKRKRSGRIKKRGELYKKSLQNRLRLKLAYYATKFREGRKRKGLQTPYKMLMEDIGGILLEECKLKEDTRTPHQKKLTEEQKRFQKKLRGMVLPKK